MRAFPLIAAVALSACAGAQLEKQRREIDELKTQAGSLLAQLKERADELEALKASKAELETRNAELAGELAIAQGRVDTLTKSNKDLAAVVGAGQDQLARQLNEAIGEKDQLARKLAETQKAQLAAERQRGVYKSARDKSAADLAKAGAERDKLSARLAELDSARKKDEDAASARRVKAREDMGAVADAVLRELQGGRASIEQSGGAFSLTLSEALLFEEGSAKLREGAAALLERLGKALKALGPREISIEAHTDNVPPKKHLLGGFDGNWELSAARSAAVSRWLHENAGLDPARLVSRALGQFRPLRANDDAAGRAANRRVVLRVDEPPADP